MCDVIAVAMGIVHNALWVDILNLDGIPCSWAKLCAFNAKDVFLTWILWGRKGSLSKTKQYVRDATHGE